MKPSAKTREQFWLDIQPRPDKLIDVRVIDGRTMTAIGSARAITRNKLDVFLATLAAGGIRIRAAGYGPPPPVARKGTN